MNILIVGNGGREHAFTWKIKQSTHCKNLYVAPGNAGTASIAENVSIAVDDFEALGKFSLEKKIDLILVGPEVPLVKGIRNYFESNSDLKSILMVGPDKTGAQLEGSKDFSKQFMLRHQIPTAKAETFTANRLQQSLAYIDGCKTPIVLKADGLAAGKGVVISESHEEAKAEIQSMLRDKKFGEASAKVLIEEFLKGIELSVFVLTDGNDYVILPEAKDYKRIGNQDTGLNTGGMGSVSPVPFAGKEFLSKVEERIIKPTIAGLKKENIHYKGFIFIGLMNVGGEPFVIEYNARMGDPETQSVMSRIQSDFVELLVACAKGELKKTSVKIDPDFALSIVMVAGGYPGEYEKGKTINGLTQSTKATVFHAGTKINGKEVVTDGGRVLAVTGKGKTLTEAREQAYEQVAKITWDGVYFRKDIGLDLLNY
ncbi:MAG: phosphoribosylamine--glycine ligase [Flammeovirgaceae bacterium]|nr:phosphoribosylamine--glycine ligase [Flammeovirgaceae bacterium]